MYDHREMKYEQKIKVISILYFHVKKETLHLQEREKTFFAEPFKTAPNVFCSHEI